PIFRLFSYKIIYGYLNIWSRLFIGLAKYICGINYQVKGFENIPKTPCIVLSKHQSMWETVFLQTILPVQTSVLKKELLKIPFFGWGLAALRPIAIDRSNLKNSILSITEHGKERLKAGIWVVLFPEGTRVEPGKTGKYAKTGFRLAMATGTPILPIAHNAGVFWPKGWWLKKPGLITVEIGELILIKPETELEVLNQQTQDWIESKSLKML
ncbi:MAG: lysophospholipid acyltransferase family protein, partial [Gammaproteobacteria bacterium]